MGRLVSVANTGLTEMLSPLDATLTKNRGLGGVMVNQISDEEIHPDEHSEGRRLRPGRKGPLFTPMRGTTPWKQMSPLAVLPVERAWRYGWKLPTGSSGRVAHAERPGAFALSEDEPPLRCTWIGGCRAAGESVAVVPRERWRFFSRRSPLTRGHKQHTFRHR